MPDGLEHCQQFILAYVADVPCLLVEIPYILLGANDGGQRGDVEAEEHATDCRDDGQEVGIIHLDWECETHFLW